MLTPIRELYDTNEERVNELKKYMVFYNSEVFTVGPIINGIACSMEEARANGENVTEKDINAVRTGLMGHVAGIGDTVDAGYFISNSIWYWLFNGIRWKLFRSNFVFCYL